MELRRSRGGGSRPVPGCDRARCEDRCRIGRGWGVIPVGYRWFRHAGGVNPCLPPTMSGRYLSFSEREDIAAPSEVTASARSLAAFAGSPSTISRELRRTRRREHGGSTTRRRSRSGMPSRGRVCKVAKLGESLRTWAQDRLAGEVSARRHHRRGRSQGVERQERPILRSTSTMRSCSSPTRDWSCSIHDRHHRSVTDQDIAGVEIGMDHVRCLSWWWDAKHTRAAGARPRPTPRRNTPKAWPRTGGEATAPASR